MDQQQIDALAKADPTHKAWGETVDAAEYGISDQIDKTSGINGGFSAKYYGAWHQIGTVHRDPNTTALDLLQSAGADNEIFKSPVTANIEVPIAPGSDITVMETITDPFGRHNVMSRNRQTGEVRILGQASKDYPEWDNRDVFLGFGDEIIRASEPTASTCCMMYGGRQVVMGFELPDGIQVGGMPDEEVRIWLVVRTSYDKSTTTSAHWSTIRPVCANTVRAGLAQKFAHYQIKKTKNADLKVKMAQEVLGLVVDFEAAAEAEFDALLKIHVSDGAFERMCKEMWGPQEIPGVEPDKGAQTTWDKKFEQLRNLFSVADTTANVRNTGYGMVQAVTEYADWNTKVLADAKAQHGGDKSDDSIRLWRSITGEKSITNPKILVTQRLLELV